MGDWIDNLSTGLWKKYDAAVANGEATIKSIASKTTKPLVNSVKWIWEALQGDFNDNRTAGQIAFDAAAGVIPIVDQVLDVRDLIANSKNIHKNNSNKAAWLALGLTLVGFIPSLGSIAKGVLKIILLTARKYGGNIARALEPAMGAIVSFLSNPKVRKVLKLPSVEKSLMYVVTKLKAVKGQVSTSTLTAQFSKRIDDLIGIINKVKYIAPASVVADLNRALEIVQSVRKQADKMLAPALQPIQKAIDDIIAYLEKKAGYKATTNTRTAHGSSSLSKIDPTGLGRAKKGLYGEIISDEYMRKKGYAQLLPEGRYARSLEDIPKGRGLDGVYENPKHLQPPKYTITETKYRQANETTGKNQYIDSDGNASDTALGMTKGSGRQMSSTWIDGNLKSEFKNHPYLLKDILDNDYTSLLMIVDQSGSVVAVSKLDSAGKTIRNVKP